MSVRVFCCPGIFFRRGLRDVGAISALRTKVGGPTVAHFVYASLSRLAGWPGTLVPGFISLKILFHLVPQG